VKKDASFSLPAQDPQRKAAKGKDVLLHRCASFVAKTLAAQAWPMSFQRARGKRPPEAQDPDPPPLPVSLFLDNDNYSFVYKLKPSNVLGFSS
jgi:hypothetical protein